MHTGWNGVHRRNMPPATPFWPPLAVAQEPDRSGFPLASFGVSVVGGANPPPPNCACADVTTRERSNAAAATSCALMTCCFLTSRSSVLRRACVPHTVRNGHDDVHLADLGQFRLQVANDLAVAALDDRAGIQGLDSVQGIVEVLKTAVDELRRIRPVFHDDAFRQEVLAERRRGRSVGN